MSKKNYVGSVCLAVKLDFYVDNTEESIEEVQERILNAGFDVKLVNEDGSDIPNDKLEITQIEGELICESARGNIKQSYTDDFWIEEDN